MTEDVQHPLIVEDHPPHEHHLSHKVYAGMWGKPEIVAVALGGLALIATIVVYMVLVLPARKRLTDAKSEQVAVEQQVNSARDRYGKISSTEEQVARLVQSASDFENAYLPFDSIGKTALYQRLNTLIANYNLVNTAGPEYTPLDIAQANGTKDEGGREKFRSIFPGVYVTMTLDGSYADIRKFISDIETSDQFVIISAVGLEPSEQGGKKNESPVEFEPPAGRSNPQFPMAPQAAPQRSARRGDTVSLKIELAAYFRRANAQPLQ